MAGKRKNYSAKFKAKVALEVIRGRDDGRRAGGETRRALDGDQHLETPGDRGDDRAVLGRGRVEGRREGGRNREASSLADLRRSRGFASAANDRFDGLRCRILIQG